MGRGIQEYDDHLLLSDLPHLWACTKEDALHPFSKDFCDFLEQALPQVLGRSCEFVLQVTEKLQTDHFSLEQGGDDFTAP